MANTSPFTAAMDATNHKELGENSSPQYTAEGVKDARVALFFALVRGIDASRIKQLMQDVITSTLVVKDQYEKAAIIADLFLLTLQTRNCRGGKGERDIFHELVLQLGQEYPNTVAKILALIPHYGCYKDWFVLSKKAQSTPGCQFIVDEVLELTVKQLLKDREQLGSTESMSSSKSAKPTGLSLLAKWCPRENKQFGAQAKSLAIRLFPATATPMKEYRKLLSKLNKALATTEIKMSANQWNKIDFGNVPSVCLMKSRKAFLNEDVKQVPSLSHDETGNRHPNDPTRVQCRKRLRETMLDSKVQKLKGKQLFPHEIVAKIGVNTYSTSKLSKLEEDLFESQWKDIRKNVLEKMACKKDKASVMEEILDGEGMVDKEPAINLGKMVPLVDVSGSMDGIPMQVAIALGLLVSEITSEAFANRCITFSEEPEWVNLRATASLSEKVKQIARSKWGGSTNFEAAIELILNVAKKAKLNPEDIPSLIVFSDMQFNSANSAMRRHYYGMNTTCGYDTSSSSDHRWETHHERIVRRFKETGKQVCGEEWAAPHIIYWNLRGDTTGFPAQADTPGVTMLSGFSPSLMKLLLDGEPFESDDDEMEVEEGEQRQSKVMKNDPYSTLRKALDDDEYDLVREMLYASNEGLLEHYLQKEGDTLEASELKGDEETWEVISDV